MINPIESPAETDIYATPTPVKEEDLEEIASGPAPCTGNETGDAAVVPAPTPAQAPVVDDERAGDAPKPCSGNGAADGTTTQY